MAHHGHSDDDALERARTHIRATLDASEQGDHVANRAVMMCAAVCDPVLREAQSAARNAIELFGQARLLDTARFDRELARVRDFFESRL